MDIENILMETAEGDVTTISVTNFYTEVCHGHAEPILKLMNGNLYEHKGCKYCANALDFQLDNVAKAWLFEK
ncbi:hypothetical protein [uncultured Enterococcus sp.]|uniref:hypothetical protein n=1 Tax=uncultured Enterococcus sp. TaxID=167972 RepID=UPI002AA67997|nr:hypothetical protein [uncultured Enterococcus sp.]